MPIAVLAGNDGVIFQPPLLNFPSPAFSGTVTGTYTLGGTPTITNPVISDGAATRFVKTEVATLSGAAIQAGVTAQWVAPAAAVILRVWLDITTASTGASTIDVGYTATDATTTSDTLFDGVSGTPAALFDSMNATLDSGANAKAQKAASGKWITITSASGDTTGLVGKLYVQYALI